MEALTFGDADYQGMPVTVLRNSVTGGRGFQLILSGEGRRLVRNYLRQAGLGLDMLECGLVAWNARRVENGLPWWGPDVTPDNFPAECRLDGVVDYEKGCFLGQETLARMNYRGHPNWLLVGLAPAAGDPEDKPESLDRSDLSGTELFSPGDRDKPAGRITSAVWSPARGGLLALGYVRHTMAGTGTVFEMELDGEKTELTVITLPPPAKEPAKG